MGPLQAAFQTGGGFATYQQLCAEGATSRSLRRLVYEGRILRLRRGVYALPGASGDGTVAARLGARLAGISAAESFGLWGGWDERLTVCVPRNSSTAGRLAPAHGAGLGELGPRVHWTDDPRDSAWCWRVSLDRCLLQTLRWSDEETAIAVVDTALTAKMIDREELLARTEHLPRVGSLVGRTRAGSGSGVESIFRQRMESTGLLLTQQPKIDGVGFVDFRVEGTRVLIEVDGYRFHSTPQKFADDRRRDAEARLRGYVPLRFTAFQVRDRWQSVEKVVLGVLSQSSGGAGVRC